MKRLSTRKVSLSVSAALIDTVETLNNATYILIPQLGYINCYSQGSKLVEKGMVFYGGHWMSPICSSVGHMLWCPNEDASPRRFQ